MKLSSIWGDLRNIGKRILSTTDANEQLLTTQILEYIKNDDQDGLIFFIKKNNVPFDKALDICLSWADSVKFTELLLKNGANPNSIINGIAPIHFAAHAKTELLKLMFDYGGDPLLIDGEGRSILHWAIVPDNDEGIAYAVRKGVPLDTPDREGLTPLCYAIRLGLLTSVKKLIKHGAVKSELSKKMASSAPQKPYMGSNTDFEDIQKIILGKS